MVEEYETPDIGQSPDSNLEMQCLANGDCLSLANDINEFLASVCGDLPKLTKENDAFTLEGEIPIEFIIGVAHTHAQTYANCRPMSTIYYHRVRSGTIHHNNIKCHLMIVILYTCIAPE